MDHLRPDLLSIAMNSSSRPADMARAIILDEDEEIFWDHIMHYLVEHVPSIERPMRKRPFSGHAYVQDILAGHDSRGYDIFRLSNTIFFQLRDLLVERGAIKATRHLGVNEQLSIFLFGIGHGLADRVLAEIFQHSGETISMHFNNVLTAILSLKREFVRLPDPNSLTAPLIRNNPNYYPYFKNALGAIDGIHVPAVVRESKHARYRNRKNVISQNVMAVVGFDNLFLYVASGWEGSAADMTVLRWALESGGFSVPDGKYYLVDSGYANTDKFLAPHRGLRYHLSEYRSQDIDRNYIGPKEKYNHRHAQLRNVVGKTFGILKRCFKILRSPIPYPYRIQCKLVIVCCILHNFIAIRQRDDQYFNRIDRMRVHESDSEDDDPTVSTGQDESERGNVLRDLITAQIWED